MALEQCASAKLFTRATFLPFPQQHLTEGATYIRWVAITLGIGPHSSLLWSCAGESLNVGLCAVGWWAV